MNINKARSIQKVSSESGMNHFIFADQTNKRWNISILLFSLFIILSAVFLILSGLSVYFNPVLPYLRVQQPDSFSHIHPSELNTLTASSHPNDQFLQQSLTSNNDVYAFYVNWDMNSERSLRHNIDRIDVLIPQWYRLNKNLELESHIEKNIGGFAKKHHVKVLPLINNENNGDWDQQAIHRLLHSPEAQSKLIKNLHKQITKNGYDGINIDFEAIQASDRNLLTEFMRNLYNDFHSDGLSVVMDVSTESNLYDYKELEKYSDRLILMLYDENILYPGPIASSKWFAENLSLISKNKLVVGLGNYGYDWNWESHQAGTPVNFEDATRLAYKANLKIQWDDISKTPYLKYTDHNKTHELWFLDSATFYNQLKTASQAGINGVALWRLGTEDPSVWDVLNGQKMEQLQTVKNGDNIYSYGQGNIYRAVSDQKEGKRKLNFDGSGFIASEVYTSNPKPLEMERLSSPSKKEIALTFDDGPDPRYTRDILRILKQNHINATFFIVGQNALIHSDLVTRAYENGNEIGIHTFSHPDTSNLSDTQLKYQLTATQRIIQGITGHSTLLYRSPYGDTEDTYDADYFKRMEYITQLGYITVNYDIDSMDWEDHNSNQMAARVLKQVSGGDILLFHDGGENKAATVKALPGIIKQLKNRGYKFVTTSQLMNKSKSEVMPAVSKTEAPLMLSIKVVQFSISSFYNLIFIVLFSLLFLLILRFSLLISLALKHKKRTRRFRTDPSFNPFVSVVIPAYNEEKVIRRTIDSVLKSDYTDFDITIVDDGSQDRTAMIITDHFSNEEQVHLIQKKNAGKTSAINAGIRRAKGDIIVAIDADTIISPQAIRQLVRHFTDKRVAAVSGNIKVGNRHNLLTIWQHLEYVIGFNLEKRAYDILNCVTVVPGAIGAWRKKAIVENGYFSSDTLAEDTDMTLSMLREGYQVVIDEQAIAYTEAPETVKDFLKQRYRWIYGTVQCFWKHKRALLSMKRKSLGFIALPNMFIFQIIIPLFAPILDIMFLIGVILGYTGQSLLFYSIYLIADFLTCFIAFRLEKQSLKPLIHLILQRIFYRYLLLYVSWKSLLSALKGTRVGWNKLKRTGSTEKREAV